MRDVVRIVCSFAVGLACSASDLSGARADHAPSLVIPGRPGVPVIINGYDASYTVVEGDWGLSRPGHVPPAIVSGPLIAPVPADSGPYFPAQGRRPGYGRREVEPPAGRRLPPPAPSYYREWGAQSQPLPANTDPPANPPPVISASPYIDLRDQADDRRDRRDDRDRNTKRGPRRNP